jgi:K+-sensing histidine kinase KdpD
MNTFFAPAERANEEQLAAEIKFVSKNPVMEGLLRSIHGLLAVLDEHRQIIAVNDSFLQVLGIDDPSGTLGLRPGEVLECVHAQDEPAGCGTTAFCSTCGAAIAIVSSLEQDEPVERTCALSANSQDGKLQDIALSVRSVPIKLENQRYLLLFLQDISEQERRAALERTFFHDIGNILCMLCGASELLYGDVPSDLSKSVHTASLRLAQEVQVQRCLSQGTSCDFRLTWQDSTTGQVMEEIESFFASHPVAHEKNLDVSKDCPDVPIRTDMSLLLRVLCNMIINAFEATVSNGVVKVWTEHEGGELSFNVWNAQEIPQDVAMRMFQRNFSTKEQAGRGFGTYSMKLFGESILGGQVSFTTSKEGGTAFKLILPG